MGGKRNTAQRTKNNAKPSSSGRSAELLEKSTTFTGFLSDNVKAPFFVGAGSSFSQDYIDPNIDPNFLVVFKRMYKKDATTKHKALQEFVGLCEQEKLETVNEVIPSWVRAYKNLVLDTENRVREGAQHAHKALVVKVGRNLAPHLKAIAPFWLISQYDTYPPAASAASSAFKEVFTPKKITDVMAFVQEDILAYLCEMVFSSSPQTIGRHGGTQEDIDANYKRIISGCLQGYSFYLKSSAPDKLQEARETNQAIVLNQKFWSLSKHEAPSIRAAWYRALSSLFDNGGDLLHDVYKNAVESVLNNLDETDPIVLPVVWEAALQVLVGVKNWWELLSSGKMVFRKLFNVLNRGGQGNAHIVYPHLLPFLSNIPESLTPNRLEFYTKFFSAMRLGMKEQSVTQSPSESDAVARTFIECIKYIILKRNEDLDLCRVLFSDQVLPTVKLTMSDPVHRLIVAPLCFELSELVHFWERNSTPANDELKSEFWSRVPVICKETLSKSKEDEKWLGHVLAYHLQLVEALRCPIRPKKKARHVKFSPDHEDFEEGSESPVELSESLLGLMKDLGREYLAIAQSSPYQAQGIRQMWRIGKLCCTEDIFVSLSSEDVHCARLVDWLEDSTIPVKALLGLLFNTIKFLKNQELKTKLFDTLNHERLKDSLIEALNLTSKGQEEEIHAWLLSDSARRTLCGFISEPAKDHAKSLEVLKYCFSTVHNKRFVVGNGTIVALLEAITTHLRARESGEGLPSILQAFYTSADDSFFAEEDNRNMCLELSRVLFSHFLQGQCDELLDVWELGISTLSRISGSNSSTFLKHVNACAEMVRKTFASPDHDIKSLLNVCKLTYLFICCSVSFIHDQADRTESALCLASKFLECTIETSSAWKLSLVPVATALEQVHGELPMDLGEDGKVALLEGKWNPLQSLHIVDLAQSVFFSFRVILLLLDVSVSSSPQIELPTKFMKALMRPKDLIGVLDPILELTGMMTLFKTLLKYCDTAKQVFDALVFLDVAGPEMKEIIQLLEPSAQEELLGEITSKIKSEGVMWEETLRVVKFTCLELEPVNEQSALITHENLDKAHLSNLKRKLTRRNSRNAGEIKKTFEIIEKQKENSQVLKGDLTKVDDLIMASEMARFFTTAIKVHSEDLSPASWDLIMVTLASWVQSTRCNVTSKQYLGILVAVCDLYVTFCEALSENEGLSKLKTEWGDLFAVDSCQVMMNSWKKLADTSSFSNATPLWAVQVERLSHVAIFISSSPQFPLDKEEKPILKLFLDLVGLLFSPCPSVQIAAYKILVNLGSHVSEIDSKVDEESLEKLSFELVSGTFLNAESIVHTMLQDLKVGETCLVEPYTDSYIYTKGYLLFWLVLLNMCKLSGSQLRYSYTLWIKKNNILPALFHCILRVMPEKVIQVREAGLKKTQELFSSQPLFPFENWTSERLSYLACWVYSTLLRVLPADARQWVTDADGKISSVVDKLTTTFVSPILCAEEMNCLKNQTKQFSNMKIVTHSTAREVVAFYSIEETVCELTITLTPNYPLSPPKVDISKVVVSTNQTRCLLMQLTVFLTLQNGNIWDGLILWKSNLDKKFEGVEECYICFSIFHSSAHTLPKLSCQTCKKKFHTYCLYKWFTVSSKSSCPICRNLF